MAEDSDEVKALKEKIALLEQQKNLLEAERLRLEAEKNLHQTEAGPSATALEANRLKEQVALLTEQRNLISAAIPTLPTGLQGTITVDDNQSVEAHAAAYRTMREVAELLAKKIEEAAPAKAEVVLLTLEDRNALATTQLFVADVDLLTKAYVGHAAPQLESVGGLLLGAGAIAKTASEVMALFRTDTEFKARTVAVADEALIAEVASRLGGRAIYYPAGFPVYARATEDVVALLQPLEQARAEALTRHRERVVHMTKVASDGTDKEKAGANARKAGLEEDWKALEAAYTKLTDSLRARDSGTGTTPLAQISRGSWLQKRLQNSETWALTLKVLHSGGTYVLRKTFWHGTQMRQSGGIVVEYLLFDSAGRLTKSGTLDRTHEFPDLALK